MSKDGSFTVTTANLAAQERMEFSKRQHMYPNFFGGFKSDIFGFQEFSKEAERLIRQARPDLEFVIDDEFMLGVEPDKTDNNHWNAMAFTTNDFHLKDSGHLWLSQSGEKKKDWDAITIRAMQWMHLSHKHSNDTLLVINMHPDNIGREARAGSIKTALEFAEGFDREIPKIFTADTNMSPDDPYGRWNDTTDELSWRHTKLRKPYDDLTEVFKDAWIASHPTSTLR